MEQHDARRARGEVSRDRQRRLILAVEVRRVVVLAELVASVEEVLALDADRVAVPRQRRRAVDREDRVAALAVGPAARPDGGHAGAGEREERLAVELPRKLAVSDRVG